MSNKEKDEQLTEEVSKEILAELEHPIKDTPALKKQKERQIVVAALSEKAKTKASQQQGEKAMFDTGVEKMEYERLTSALKEYEGTWDRCCSVLAAAVPIEKEDGEWIYEKAVRYIKMLESQKNQAYAERNRLVAALSKLFPASLERHEGENWEDDWRWVVYIDLPTGQASWHIHDSELELFQHLERNTGRKWDGHSPEEKYKRLEQL